MRARNAVAWIAVAIALPLAGSCFAADPVLQSSSLPPPPPLLPPPPPASDSTQSLRLPSYVPPFKLTNQPPKLPEEALCRQLTGQAKLVLTISPTGSVTDAVVEKSSGHPSLDGAAHEAGMAWRFRPAFAYGVPVGSRARVPVDFVAPAEWPHCSQGVRVLATYTLLGSEGSDTGAAMFTPMFAPSDKVSAVVEYVLTSPDAVGESLSVRWIYLDDAGHPVIHHEQTSPLQVGGRKRVVLSGAQPGSWKPGRYQIEVRLKDDVLGQGEFAVR
ncbi:MAG TPA: energy transducer TonB [Lysobacter sp.]